MIWAKIIWMMFRGLLTGNLILSSAYIIKVIVAPVDIPGFCNNMIYFSFLNAILFRSWKVIRTKSEKKLPELTHYMKHPVSFPPAAVVHIYMLHVYFTG